MTASWPAIPDLNLYQRRRPSLLPAWLPSYRESATRIDVCPSIETHFSISDYYRSFFREKNGERLRGSRLDSIFRAP